jgi:hypothetical protein
VVVVVGGLVVVDVGLLVAGVGDTPETLGAVVGTEAGTGAGGTVVGVVLEVVAAAGAGSGGFTGGADAPGCSFATATPMHAVAPPARTIAVLVSRVIRVCTLARSLGLAWAGPRFMACSASRHRLRHAIVQVVHCAHQRTGRPPRDASTSRWNLAEEFQPSG